MKYKFLIGIAAAALVTGIGMTAVKAEETAAPAPQTCTYVDADGDGICDNRGTRQCGGSFIDANNDGICDNSGSGQCSRYGQTAGTGCGRARRAGLPQNN